MKRILPLMRSAKHPRSAKSKNIKCCKFNIIATANDGGSDQTS